MCKDKDLKTVATRPVWGKIVSCCGVVVQYLEDYLSGHKYANISGMEKEKQR